MDCSVEWLLGIGGGILVLALAGGLFVHWIRARYRPHGVHDEVRAVETTDGWKLAVYAYLPKPTTRRHPVLLVHGLGSTHCTWDLEPWGPSLADHLRKQGWMVFTVDLRGRMGSDGPHTGRGFRWSVDDFLQRDLPAVIGRVRAWSGADRVHWIGHSMGGALGYAYQIQHGADSIRSLLVLASSLDYTKGATGYNLLLWTKPLLRVLPFVPIGIFSALFAPFLHLNTYASRFVWYPGNMDARRIWAVSTSVLRNAGAAKLLQLAGLIQKGGMRSRDGKINFTESIGRVRSPLLAMVGDQDLQCSVGAVRWSVEQAGSEVKRAEVFGPAFGHRTSYGHYDLVCGTNAPAEVWPRISDWVESQDAPL